MDSKEINVKSPVKRLTGQLSTNQQHRFRSQSKDKLNNGKNSCIVHKNKNASKVPRVVRAPSKSNLNKSRVGGKVDVAGDNKAGPSKSPNTPKKNAPSEKLKPSHIPRWKTTLKEIANKESPAKKDCDFLGDNRNSRNVQRIQLLINQEYRPEERVPGTTIGSTRPIPTLGQIYARNHVLDTDRLNGDWFVEQDTPTNSIASNFFNISSRIVNSRVNAENDITTTNKYHATAVSNMEFDGAYFPKNAFKSTKENVNEWLTTDIEYPTRDNESGYRSLSPPAHTPRDVKSTNSKCSFISDQTENEQQLSQSNSKKSIPNSFDNEKTATILKEQPTVIITQLAPAKMNQKNNNYGDGAPGKLPKTGINSKNYQYPSRSTKTAPAAAQAPASQPQVTVPSYVECPSEVLQKTTNFEDLIPVTCDSPKTVSSITAADSSSFRDDLSSQYTLEHDECCIGDRCALDWCHRCRSRVRDEKSNDSVDTSVADSLICQYNDDLLDSSLMNSSDDHYVHHCRWKRHYDAKRHCKKCQRYTRFPSTRYKLPKTLTTLRKRMSLRMCRRRLSRVWKKTTERWAMWSAKSPRKFRKLRMMHYLQRSILWEDANVQTNVFVFRETGTAPALKEQKSTAISAILKLGSSSVCNKNVSGASDSPPAVNLTTWRHVKQGPSMIPFFYNNSKKKSVSQVKRNSSGKENDVDNVVSKATNHETKKNENHVITQTLSYFTKDKNDKKIDESSICQESHSDNYIEICEVSMDNKDTETLDMASPMKDGVTSTVLDNWEAQNAYTEMRITCNNAETYVKFQPMTRDTDEASVLISTSEDTISQIPCGTNTDLKTLLSKNIMTSKEVLRRSPTFGHTETQVTPVQSLRNISTGVNRSTEMDGSVEHDLQDFTNQVMPQRSSFLCSVNKSTSTSKDSLKETCTLTSRKEFECAEVLTSLTQIKSDVCLSSPSLLLCQCPDYEISSCGTGTSNKQHTTSNNKLKTYLNTGMLINTLVEGAMKSHVRPPDEDTKSIGNKYKSEIATCTNSELKGSVIEKEKDRYPTRLSVDTSTSLKCEPRRTEHKAGTNAVVPSQEKADNGTQYNSYTQRDKTSCDIGHSRLLSIRTLSHSANETGTQSEPVRVDCGCSYVPKQYKSTSMFGSQCTLDPPIKHAALLPKECGNKQILPSSEMASPAKSRADGNSSLRINSAILSSNLDADTWIKSGIEKGFHRQKDVGRSSDENKHTSASDSNGSKSSDDNNSKSIGLETQSENQHVTNNVTTVASAMTNMSLEKYDKMPTKDTNAKQVVKMVDNVTSDEVVRKQVKEITLQAKPDNNSEAETKCTQTIERKSVGVFTSRCILPPPEPCNCHNNGSLRGDCLLVYGKPKCVVHSNEQSSDAAAQISFCRIQPAYNLSPAQQDLMLRQHFLRSVGLLSSYCGLTSDENRSEDIVKIQTPKVYETLYDTAKKINEEEVRFHYKKNFYYSVDVDRGRPGKPRNRETETNILGPVRPLEVRSAGMLTSPDVRSAAMITSQCGLIQKRDQFTQQDFIGFPSKSNFSFLWNKRDDREQPQAGLQGNYDKTQARLLDMPTHDDDPDPDDSLEQRVKTHLATSCRYYSNLLTKQLDKVRDNLTKHLTPSTEPNYTYNLPNTYTEACTMKPSAREEFGCQTFKNQPCYKASRLTTTLSPAVSLTDICQHDKEHLKSVYYMLTAIEGRLRRFKSNIE